MAAPDLNTSRKREVKEAIREATGRLHTKEVIGAEAGGRLGIGCEKMRWLSNDYDSNRHSMVVDGIGRRQ